MTMQWSHPDAAPLGPALDAALQEQARVHSAALRAISQGVIVTGPDFCVVSANDAFLAITGYQESDILGRHCRFLEGPDTDPATLKAIGSALCQSRPFSGEVLNYRKDGTTFWNELTISPVFDAQGAVTHFVGVTHDVTERRRTQDEAQQKERRLSNAEALAEFGSWDWQLEDGNSTWSDKLFEIYGRDKAQGVPAFEAWEETIHPEDRDKLGRCIQQGLAAESRYSVEFRIHAKDTGAMRYISSRGVSKVDKQGKVIGIWGVDQDITASKRAAQALQASLHEKEALLREVHHRVKNNLQVITSLLRLESYRSAQPDTRSVLDDMQGRIRAMAVLHESLHHAGLFSSVDLGAYLRDLVGQVFRAHAQRGVQVRLQLALASVQVGMDQATPCGLIVNELVSNSLKHGFPGGHGGEVRVELRNHADTHRLELRVSDSGVGLPADFDARRSQSLGLQLVSDLVGQIDGQFEVGRATGQGACFTITCQCQAPLPAPQGG